MKDLPPPIAEWNAAYHPVSKPTPEGWRDDGDLSDCHHGFYSRVISDRPVTEEGT